MVNKRKKAVQYILMVLITLLVVFPFLWMLVLSFKTNSEILSSPLSLPKTFNFENYRHAMGTLNFPKLYGNTLFVCVISLVAELIITFFSSFVLARMEFKNEKIRKMLYGFLIMGLSISPFVFRTQREACADLSVYCHFHFLQYSAACGISEISACRD